MKKIFLSLLLLGILLRFILQFLFPSFNVDEISLGNNIKHSGFIQLLYPLQFGQSSPPLFLWLQKLTISIAPCSFWVNIKIISFLSSVAGIILFFIFIKNNNYQPIFLLLFSILLFNPFIINNSLTVKQYTFDLTGVIFMLVYFKSTWFQRRNWIFFLFWSLASNIGLFACVGYLLYNLIINRPASASAIYSFIKKNFLTFLAPLPYVFYFCWFMQQKGAAELKLYMVKYWSDSFIPINGNIFKYLMYAIHGLWIYMFCSFELWGIFLMIICIPFFFFLKNKEYLFKHEIALLCCILFIHLTLNVLHLYPFSDRLYLYLAPLLLLILGSSITSMLSFNNKYITTCSILFSVMTLTLYSFYLPYKENDVVSLYKKLNNINENNFYATEKALDCINTFNDFTENKFKPKQTFVLLNSNASAGYLISRVAKKIKRNVTAPEETSIQDLINSNQITKIDCVSGYNIYQIKK